MKKHLKKKFSVGQMLKLGLILFIIWAIHTNGGYVVKQKNKRHAQNRKDYQVLTTRQNWMAKRVYSLPRLVLSRLGETINE